VSFTSEMGCKIGIINGILLIWVSTEGSRRL